MKEFLNSTPGETKAAARGDPEESGRRNGDGAARGTIKCPACGYGFITRVNGKRKLRTRVLIFTENGDAMGICPKCKANLKVPISLETLGDADSRGDSGV